MPGESAFCSTISAFLPEFSPIGTSFSCNFKLRFSPEKRDPTPRSQSSAAGNGYTRTLTPSGRVPGGALSQPFRKGRYFSRGLAARQPVRQLAVIGIVLLLG